MRDRAFCSEKFVSYENVSLEKELKVYFLRNSMFGQFYTKKYIVCFCKWSTITSCSISLSLSFFLSLSFSPSRPDIGFSNPCPRILGCLLCCVANYKPKGLAGDSLSLSLSLSNRSPQRLAKWKCAGNTQTTHYRNWAPEVILDFHILKILFFHILLGNLTGGRLFLIGLAQ